ncbi:hypothetical protein [Cedecea davisae]|uniref:hypothetical protein n=1 Tax=Cedecea davisae TaxID=158484 RepID=UPI001D0ACF0D|nr:hypothetical protein [Cedecea davisae]
MSILTMKRFWISLALPALIALVAGKSVFVLTSVAWLPVSAFLLVWALFSSRREKKQAAEIERIMSKGNSNQIKEITTPKFQFLGKIYTLEKTFSGRVIEVRDDYLWAKGDNGEEKRLKTGNVHFRNEHRIRLFNLQQYDKNGSLLSIHGNGVIMNDTTNIYDIEEFNADLYTPKAFSYIMIFSFIAGFIAFCVWAYTLNNYGYVALLSAVLIYIFLRIIKSNRLTFNHEVRSIANRF